MGGDVRRRKRVERCRGTGGWAWSCRGMYRGTYRESSRTDGLPALGHGECELPDQGHHIVQVAHPNEEPNAGRIGRGEPEGGINRKPPTAEGHFHPGVEVEGAVHVHE